MPWAKDEVQNKIYNSYPQKFIKLTNVNNPSIHIINRHRAIGVRAIIEVKNKMPQDWWGRRGS